MRTRIEGWGVALVGSLMLASMPAAANTVMHQLRSAQQSIDHSEHGLEYSVTRRADTPQAPAGLAEPGRASTQQYATAQQPSSGMLAERDVTPRITPMARGGGPLAVRRSRIATVNVPMGCHLTTVVGTPEVEQMTVRATQLPVDTGSAMPPPTAVFHAHRTADASGRVHPGHLAMNFCPRSRGRYELRVDTVAHRGLPDAQIFME